MVSCATTSMSIAALGSYFYLNERFDTCVSAETCPTYGAKADLLNSLSWLPLTSLIVYRFGNNLGLGPLPWLINGEIFSEEAKGTSSSIVTVTHWTSVFFVTRYATNLQVRNNDAEKPKRNRFFPQLRD